MKKRISDPVSSHHHSDYGDGESSACLGEESRKRNTVVFHKNQHSLAKRLGKDYRTFSLNICDIPDLCLPAVLSTEKGGNHVILLEKVKTTLRVGFPDGREALVSQYHLEKIYDGICSLPVARGTRSRRVFHWIFGQISNLLADNPFKVSVALLANLLTLALVLFVKAGYEQNISANVANRPLLIIGAGLTAGLLAYGITGLRFLLNRVQRNDRKRQVLYPDFSGSNVDAVIDLALLPIFLALSLSIGGIVVTTPLLMGIAFVGSHFLRTRLLQSLLAFPRIWAGPFQWLIFLTTSVSVWMASGTSGLTLGGLISSLLIASVSMERLARAAGFARNFRLALMGTPAEDPKHKVKSELSSEENFTGITASNLFYTYPQSGSIGLFEVNFSIEPGERIGLFGVAGSGKSTLCRILAGVICPEHGKVRTNGKIGYLGSDAAIVHGTLRSNILLGHGDTVPNYRIEKMLRFVGLENLVEQNPLGLDMPVQERGESLTLLQRRVLCLARVLLHRPDILILDEPMSQLDRKEADLFLQIINQYWQERSQTRILLSSISSRSEIPCAEMDRVLIMDSGRIVGQSSSGQLRKIIEVAGDSGQNTGPALESAACHQLQ